MPKKHFRPKTIFLPTRIFMYTFFKHRDAHVIKQKIYLNKKPALRRAVNI